jgi:hypothetical protein
MVGLRHQKRRHLCNLMQKSDFAGEESVGFCCEPEACLSSIIFEYVPNMAMEQPLLFQPGFHINLVDVHLQLPGKHSETQEFSLRKFTKISSLNQL